MTPTLCLAQRPVKQTVCGTLRQGSNWKCFFLTMLIIACLAAITWCRLTQIKKVIVNFSVFPITRTRHLSPCEDGYLYIPVAFLAMLYLLYLVECFHCPSRIQLGHMTPAGVVSQRIEAMRSTQPVIWWKAMCYHYVRRTRQITRYRNGDAYTTTQVFYERVNAHAAGTCFLFSNCGVKDISKKLVDLSKYPITKLKFSKGFAFANVEAANEFEEQRSRFFQENERRDDYMEMREGLDLTGVSFKEFLIACRDTEPKPWYTHHAVFWVASLFLLSWPLRLIIEYNTAYVHFQVTTKFKQPPAVNNSRLAQRASQGYYHHIIECSAIFATFRTSLYEKTGTTSNVVSPPRQASDTNFTSGHYPLIIQCSDIFALALSSTTMTTMGISRTSLVNGYMLYFPCPLIPCTPADPFQGARRTVPVEAPPNYEDALKVSAPLLTDMNPSPLRRSHTERNIPSLPRLTLPRRSMHCDLETQL
ncbi:unnamed protein product, partial [Meganyctiphanes norvegica]